MPLLPLDVLADAFPGVLDMPRRLAPRTLEKYRRDMQHYLAWCGYVHERAMEPVSLRGWVQHMVEHTRLSPHTINRRLRAVQSIIAACAQCEAIDPGLAYRFKLVQGASMVSLRGRLGKRRMVLTPDQVRELCRASDASTLVGLRDRALLYVLASTGCRISEAVSMKRDDVAPYGGSWLVQILGKGQWVHRQAPMSHEAYVWLQRWLSARDSAGTDVACVFTGFVGRYKTPTTYPVTIYTAWGRVKKYGARSGCRSSLLTICAASWARR